MVAIPTPSILFARMASRLGHRCFSELDGQTLGQTRVDHNVQIKSFAGPNKHKCFLFSLTISTFRVTKTSTCITYCTAFHVYLLNQYRPKSHWAGVCYDFCGRLSVKITQHRCSCHVFFQHVESLLLHRSP